MSEGDSLLLYDYRDVIDSHKNELVLRRVYPNSDVTPCLVSYTPGYLL